MNSIVYNLFVLISEYVMNIMSIRELKFKIVQIGHDYIYISRSLVQIIRKQSTCTTAFVKSSVRDRCIFIELRTTSGTIRKN